MSRIKEEFTLTFGDHIVWVINEGTKCFKDQNPEALPDLKDVIRESLIAGDCDGFIPYNNFESAVKWELVEDID